MHEAVFFQLVHLACLGLARFQKAQRLGDRDLEDKDLPLGQRGFGDAVAGLDDGGIKGGFGGHHAGGLLEEAADRDRVGRVIGALVDDFQHVLGHQAGRCDLHAAGAPTVGHRHLAAGKGDLIAGDRDGFQQRAADHAFGVLVKVGEVVVGHSAAFWVAKASARSFRISSSSAWKST